MVDTQGSISGLGRVPASALDANRRLTGLQSGGWRAALTGGLLTWLAVKVAMAVLAALVLAIRDGPSVSDPAGLAVPDTAAGFFGVLGHWDSNYFLGVASGGYFGAGSDATVQSFFPGYPAIARGMAEIIAFGAPSDAALTLGMWLVSAIASMTAAVLLWRLVADRYPRAAARWATVLLLTGPYSVFLFANYSESLFLAFAVAAWYCAVKDRWVLVGVFAAAATFTRINGVFLVAALLVLYVQQRRRAGAPAVAPALLWLPLACTGIGAYFGYLTARTGDLLAWSHAQTLGWGRTMQWPWDAFYQTAGRALLASTPDRRFQRNGPALRRGHRGGDHRARPAPAMAGGHLPGPDLDRVDHLDQLRVPGPQQRHPVPAHDPHRCHGHQSAEPDDETGGPDRLVDVVLRQRRVVRVRVLG